MLDKKQERRRWIIVGALFLDLIDFEESGQSGKILWLEVRPFFNWALKRNDHRYLYGLKKLPSSALTRGLIASIDPGNLIFNYQDLFIILS